MKNILITGGPVHAYLDAVKVITNRFKGGLITQLADNLLSSHEAHITYIASELVGARPMPHKNLTVHLHKGLEHYERLVLELAPRMDAIILGAAVANLIPAKRIEGKFPSHNYKPGDIIPIDFTIAPRVIDKVKTAAPHAHLFGFKLLSGVTQDELIHAAYDIVLNSRATAVFANDSENLIQKYAVTKERGVHPMEQHELADWIWEIIHDEYYRTSFVSAEDSNSPIWHMAVADTKELIQQYAEKFTKVENGMIFGTVAVRYGSGFITTGRGKRELDDVVPVLHVYHDKRQIVVAGSRKASLNAPLLARIFENPKVDYIVHYHEQIENLPTHPYAPAGTVRDVKRPVHTSFNIKEHGCMLLFDKHDKRL